MDFKVKNALIKSEQDGLSVQKQCALLDFNRSSYYYQPIQISQRKLSILREVDNIYTEIPFFGYRKVYQQLLENGFKVGVNQVAKAHKKHPYLLLGMDINKPNQVWSTDITYIRVTGGFVYLAAVIDWYYKLLIEKGIKISMDGRGRATDNIAIERFWTSAKYENIYIQEYATIREFKTGINDYIEFYNYKRFHQSLKYQKPMNVYNCLREETLKLAA